ncbi:hypothetical protein FQN57_006089 [Myotisia sp. PD_48]|nr:hypothetical protein FQN57_006089 [Myotisia sp. PD_48]
MKDGYTPIPNIQLGPDTGEPCKLGVVDAPETKEQLLELLLATFDHRIRHPDAEDCEQKDRPLDLKFKREVRWHYLLSFQNDGIEKLISSVYGTDDQTTFTFSSARTMGLDLMKGWKNRSTGPSILTEL